MTRLRNASLAVTTMASMAIEDPALLVVQVSRRLPATLTTRLGDVLVRVGRRPGSAPTVLGHWLAGRRDAARTALAARATPPGRVLAELAVELGTPTTDDRGGAAARARWSGGDLSGAVEAAAVRPALQRRLAAERSTMLPGRTLPVRRGPRVEGRELAAFHLLTSSLPHTSNGYALRSHRILRAQQDAGIDVAAATRITYPVCIGRLGARDRDVVDGVSYARLLPARSARTLDARLAQAVDLALPLVAAHRPGVLHTTSHYVNGLVTRALAQSTGLPWVYEVRGLPEETWSASRPSPAARADARSSERFALLRAKETEVAAAADHVVTLSRTMRDELVGRGISPDRITVVPNGVDARLLTLVGDPADARGKLGLPRDGFWVGTVSSLVDYEGVDTLVSAVAELRARGVDVRAAIVGDGVARPALVAQAESLGVASHVVFTGRVPRDEAVRWHQALDVFVVPRRDDPVCRLVTPLKPMEAMALGRPVVVSDLPALREIVVEPGAGVAVEASSVAALADAVEELAGEPERISELGAAGQEFSASRSWAAAGSSYRNVYHGLAAKVAA